MTFTREADHGTPPALTTGKPVTLTIDGQSVTMPEGFTLRPGTGANRQLRSQIARMVSASAIAKRAPTQVRGPAPNGRY